MKLPQGASLPEFIPDKQLIWSQLVIMAKEDRTLTYAHVHRAPPILVRSVVDRVFARLKCSQNYIGDDHFMMAVIREFCDPAATDHPDTEPYKGLI